ncbi:MAG: phage holin family protein [Coriobacteriales bacterium]|jgi:putative membrane protein|nr:phage holin family protein [Coriobacteriales bacterium]
MKAIVTWLITAVAVAAAVWLIPGIDILGANATLSIAILAVILAFLNAFIKPVLQLISLPITFITLGIFALVINTIVLYIAAWAGNGLFNTGFLIEGFWSALLASIVISLVSAILGAITGVKDKR